MSFLDRFIAAVSLPESEDALGDARSMARAAATPGDWLSQIVDHHIVVEEAFAAVKAAGDSTARTAAFRRLGIVLMGHMIAKEAAIYPALAQRRTRSFSDIGYDEQAMFKIQLAMLERLNPMSESFMDKLEHLHGALIHHSYCEEGRWFLDLKRETSPFDQSTMTERYAEIYGRFVRDE